LVIVMPVLGHASWHLYRKLVAPQPGRVARTRAPGIPRSRRSPKAI
jgi:uncharacterized membrane protein